MEILKQGSNQPHELLMSISEGGTLSPPGKTSVESVGVKISENPKNSWKCRSFENLWILCNGVFSSCIWHIPPGSPRYIWVICGLLTMASWSPLRRGPGQQSSGEIWHRGRHEAAARAGGADRTSGKEMGKHSCSAQRRGGWWFMWGMNENMVGWCWFVCGKSYSWRLRHGKS